MHHSTSQLPARFSFLTHYLTFSCSVIQLPLQLRCISISSKASPILARISFMMRPPRENMRSTGADVAGAQSSLQNRGVSKRYSFTANILGCSSASKSSMLIAATYFARTASGESVAVVVVAVGRL